MNKLIIAGSLLLGIASCAWRNDQQSAAQPAEWVVTETLADVPEVKVEQLDDEPAYEPAEVAPEVAASVDSAGNCVGGACAPRRGLFGGWLRRR
jgi:hypothetical protein